MKAARLVRHFTGHQDRVTDMVLSKDGRWLLSSSLDGTLHVWDIPAGRILQVGTMIWLIMSCLSTRWDFVLLCIL